MVELAGREWPREDCALLREASGASEGGGFLPSGSPGLSPPPRDARAEPVGAPCLPSPSTQPSRAAPSGRGPANPLWPLAALQTPESLSHTRGGGCALGHLGSQWRYTPRLCPTQGTHTGPFGPLVGVGTAWELGSTVQPLEPRSLGPASETLMPIGKRRLRWRGTEPRCLWKCPSCCAVSHLELGAPGARHVAEDWHFGAASWSIAEVLRGLKIQACHFKIGSFYTPLRRPFRVLHEPSYTS